MLSLDARTNQKAYSYVAGMLNVAYLVGFARNIESKRTGFLLQQTNNLNHALPITLAPNTKLPHNLMEGEPVKVIAHVYGKRLESGERTCVIDAISFERPTILEIPPSMAWSQFLPEGAPQDAFNPFREGIVAEPSEGDLESVNEVERERVRLGKNANLMYCAGFVDNYMFGVDKEGKIQRDCLIMLLRQHAEHDKCIPIRHYGKYAAPYKRAMAEERKSVAQVGFPLLVEGQLRVRVKPLEDAKDGVITPVEKTIYVHCPHPQVATRKEIVLRPQWMTELFERAIKAKQADASEEAPQLAPVASQQVLQGGAIIQPQVIAAASRANDEKDF